MMEPTGVKELKELLEGVGLLAGAYKEIMSDGKVDISDLATAVKLATESEKLVAAFSDLSKVGDELKDMDRDEAKVLVDAVYDVLAKFKK